MNLKGKRDGSVWKTNRQNRPLLCNSVPLSRVLAEEDADDIVQASYSYGNDLLAMKQDGEVYYFFYDRLGSVRNVTDDGNPASTVRSYLSDAFGNVVASSGTITSAYQFTGEEYDSDPELVYLRARYYNPEEGRFISRDPLMEQLALTAVTSGCSGCGARFHQQLQVLHPYVYCANNPLNGVDPEGSSNVRLENCGGWICGRLMLFFSYPKICYKTCDCWSLDACGETTGEKGICQIIMFLYAGEPEDISLPEDNMPPLIPGYGPMI